MNPAAFLPLTLSAPQAMLSPMLRVTLVGIILALCVLAGCNRSTAPGQLQNSRTFEQQASRPDPTIVPEPKQKPPRSTPETESEIDRLRRENQALRNENATLKRQNP